MDFTQILVFIGRAPDLVKAIRAVGIPVSVVSGALRLLADALDGIDRTAK